MPNHGLGYRSSGGSDALDELRWPLSEARDRGDSLAGEADGLGQSDQVARDLAEIERAADALRRAQPALKTWSAASEFPAAALPKPRPVWLLIGFLWLSTALVTAGAVAAIARFAG
ncbi:MAG: hypothetical protein ACRECE_07750 [Xanthobacteraceae bacterium]